MVIKKLVKILLLITLVSVVLSENDHTGDCAEIENLVKKEKPEFESFDGFIDECQVDDKGKLINIYIEADQFSSDFLTKIFKYDTLKKLSLFRAKFQQSYIDQISALTNLEELNFQFCNFNKNVNYDSFKKLSKLNSLEIFYFEENNIIPDFIKDLDMKKIKIIGIDLPSIPDYYFNFKNLESLDLHGNPIPEIPKDIANLKNLKELDLGKTSITKIPEYIDKLSKLEVLKISYKISEFPDELANLKNLKELDCSNCQLEKFPKVLEKLENLVTLDLSLNKIYDTLPEYFNNFSKLEKFIINGNINIKGKTLTNDNLLVCKYSENYNLCIAKDIPCLGSKIKEIYKPCSNEDDLPKEDQCEGIYNVLNENTSVYHLECKTFENGKVKTLKINTDTIKNPQAVLDKISELTEIEELTILDFNFKPELKYNGFKNLKNIKTLLIKEHDGNTLSKIPDEFYSLTTLKELTIIEQNITSISDKIANLKNLEKLILASNSITTIPKAIAELKNLQVLNLDDNPIDQEIPEFLNDLPNLMEINLDIEKLKGKTLTNENLVYCYYNFKADLCIAKDMECLKNFKFKTCNSNDNNDDDTKISTNDRCGKDKGNCPSGTCCSKYGWCGTSNKHCSIKEGCQSKFGECHDPDKVSTNGRCGPNDGKCPSGKCCSKYGWCGASDEYCAISKGCQSEFGKCSEEEIPIVKENKKGKCGKGYGKCPSGQCCSAYGWCGTDERYCGAGCQSKFGKCK